MVLTLENMKGIFSDKQVLDKILNSTGLRRHELRNTLVNGKEVELSDGQMKAMSEVLEVCSHELNNYISMRKEIRNRDSRVYKDGIEGKDYTVTRR